MYDSKLKAICPTEKERETYMRTHDHHPLSDMKFLCHVRGICRRELKDYVYEEDIERIGDIFDNGTYDVLMDFRYEFIDEDDAFFLLLEEYYDAKTEFENSYTVRDDNTCTTFDSLKEVMDKANAEMDKIIERLKARESA